MGLSIRSWLRLIIIKVPFRFFPFQMFPLHSNLLYMYSYKDIHIHTHTHTHITMMRVFYRGEKVTQTFLMNCKQINKKEKNEHVRFFYGDQSK